MIRSVRCSVVGRKRTCSGLSSAGVVEGGGGARGAGGGQPSSGASSEPSAHCGTPSHALYTAMHSPPRRHANW